MGLFKKMTGGVDKSLMESGLLGRGQIVGVQPMGTTVQMGNGLVERKCQFQIQVMLDGEPPFAAVATQRVPEVYLAQVGSGQAVVAVRVDPNDRSKVAIDFNTEPPNVRLAANDGPGSAADILATGTPVTVVLVQNQPMGIQNAAGHDMHALTLTVSAEGENPYQIQVGNAVPPEALPLLYPGSHLHAKRGGGPNEIVVDWAAGSAQ
jgi:hypothetical protein